MQLHNRMQGQNVALKNRKEWCIISETLFHSTNYWSIHRKCAQMPPSSGNMEGCPSWATTRHGLNKVWLGAWPPRYPVPSCTLCAPPDVLQLIHGNGNLGVSLQHVAARKLGARSSVYVRVQRPAKILWRAARRMMNPKRLLRTQMTMICDETIIKLMQTHHKHAKLHSCLNKLDLTLNIRPMCFLVL